MLGLYSFDLKDYPEDEASVPKHVEINISHKLYFIQCICWLVYLMTRVIKTNGINGRLTGLVTFCVKTAFYSGLLKAR